MTDNLQNNWGVDLLVDSSDERTTRSGSNVTSYNEKNSIISINTIFKPFAFDSFKLTGSSANANAIMRASSFQMDTCIVGCGSYVGGQLSDLQDWSSSKFARGDRLASIETNIENLCGPACQQTVALPYFISINNETIDSKRLKSCERRCRKEIEHRILYSRLINRPISSMFLELILAGCGACLTRRFLITIGRLCARENIKIIVDEIMTSVRCGETLLTLNTPNVFRRQVAYITLGKWSKIGIVLKNPKNIFVKSNERNTTSMSDRGSSFVMTYKETFKQLSMVHDAIQKVEIRRKETLRAIKKSSKECWGEGCLIFSDNPQVVMKGLGCRYLPMLAPGLNISINSRTSNNNHKKENIATSINEQVLKWIQISKTVGTQCNRAVVEYVYKLKRGGKTFIEESNRTKLKLAKELCPEGDKQEDYKKAIQMALTHNLLGEKLIGSKRKRTLYAIDSNSNAPLKKKV